MQASSATTTRHSPRSVFPRSPVPRLKDRPEMFIPRFGRDGQFVLDVDFLRAHSSVPRPRSGDTVGAPPCYQTKELLHTGAAIDSGCRSGKSGIGHADRAASPVGLLGRGADVTLKRTRYGLRVRLCVKLAVRPATDTKQCKQTRSQKDKGGRLRDGRRGLIRNSDRIKT